MSVIDVHADHNTPHLWVETLSLLRSLDDEEPLRTVKMHPGVNLIVSPSLPGNVGHGVGKTAFCQLLRFALDDHQAWDGTLLHEELRHTFPDGAVVARVHVGGEAWTVLKPWTHQKQYRASQQASWRELARNREAGGYAAYQQALQQHLVDRLPVRDLPGSGQRIEWRHLLAWCSRDQNARYRNYYAWRDKGVGFSQPTKAPALVLRVALGLLQDTSILQAIEAQNRTLEEVQRQLEATKRQQRDLLEHARRQLSLCLRAPDDTPFRSPELLEVANLAGLAHDAALRTGQRLHDIREQLNALETERHDLLKRRAPLDQHISQLRNWAGQLQAMIDGNLDGLRKLQSEAESLQQQGHVYCEQGGRTLAECEYVKERIHSIQLDRAQTAAERKGAITEHEQKLESTNARIERHLADLQPLEEELERLSRKMQTTSEQRLELLRQQQRLDDAIALYEHYERVTTGEDVPEENVTLQSRLVAAYEEISRLELHRVELEHIGRDRRAALRDLTDRIAAALPGFTWGLFDDSEERHPRPFRIGPPDSTTFRVLETLVGDVAALLDSLNPDSFHPGFLLHDSPREAEMSEGLLWALVTYAAEHGGEAVQYLVTTSTAAPEGLRDRVRLELHARDNTGLLFRRRLGVEQDTLNL